MKSTRQLEKTEGERVVGVADPTRRDGTHRCSGCFICPTHRYVSVAERTFGKPTDAAGDALPDDAYLSASFAMNLGEIQASLSDVMASQYDDAAADIFEFGIYEAEHS
ncbi:MAG: hypothetical protein R3C68_15045 [Myxococcota bacterium]